MGGWRERWREGREKRKRRKRTMRLKMDSDKVKRTIEDRLQEEGGKGESDGDEEAEK